MAADTFSGGLGYLQMQTGNDPNNWGTNANASVFQILEDAIANVLTTTASAGQLGPSNTLDLSTSPPPAGPSAARYAILIFGGAITANQIVKVPNLSKHWFVANATTGAFTVQIQTPSGSPSVPIPQNGQYQSVICNGNNNIAVAPIGFGGTNGQLLMPGDSAAAPTYSFAAEANSGWYRAGTQDVRLSINGADVLQVTGTGAGSPSIVNVLSPNVFQQGGATIPSIALPWVAAGGTVDAITATYSPAITALTDGLLLAFRATGANATATPSFSPNGLTAHPITKRGGGTLATADIIGAGHEILVRYNLANTRWEMISHEAPVWAAKAFFTSTDSMSVANGTTGQRNGSPTAADFRYNSTINCFEGWNGTSWVQLGTAPTAQNFTTGSGTYTPTPGTVRARVRMAGGGGGGGANGNGAATSLGGWTAAAGSGATGGSNRLGGAGGTGGTNGTGTLIKRIAGGVGQDGLAFSSVSSGTIISMARGGTNPLGNGANSGAGSDAVSTIAYNNNTINFPGGGGAGEYVEFYITNPGALAYSIGAAGPNGQAGVIMIEEFYW